MKNMYSHREEPLLLPGREGRDSMRVMLTRCSASGERSACTAPGLFSADMTSEVRSLPVGAGSRRPSTRKRVVLLGSSSIERASAFSLYRTPAASPAIAAAPFSFAARCAASALEPTGTRSAFGRFWPSQLLHWARDWACEYTRLMLFSSFSLLRRFCSTRS